MKKLRASTKILISGLALVGGLYYGHELLSSMML